MKNIIRGFVVSLALSSFVWAAMDTTSPSTTVSPTGSDGTSNASDTSNSSNSSTKSMATGTVKSIDRSGNRVRIESQGQTTEYTLSDQTAYMKSGKTSSVTNVNAGDSVTFEYDPTSMLVTRVEVNNPQ